MASRGKEPARFTKAPETAGVTHAARNYGKKGMEISNMKHGSGALQTRIGCTDTYVWREREAARLSYIKSCAKNANFGDANRPFDVEDWYDEDDWVDEDEDEDEDEDDWVEDDSEFEVGVDKVKDGVYKVPPLLGTPYIVRGGQGNKGVTFVEYETSTRKSSEHPKPVDDDAWIVKGPMPGGPYDGTVIPSFGGHVAKRIWEGKPRGVLKCYNLTNACESLVGWKKSLSPGLKARIAATGLGHLPSCMFKHIDMPLISAFVERWQPDTNSFHLPFGEMTIMLHDVWQILRIPVDGCLNISQSSSKDLFYDMFELLRSTPDELVAPPTPHWSDDGVSIESILALCRDDTSVDPDTKFTSWMFLMLGASLFVDKNESRIRPSSILEVKDDCNFERIPKYAWGAATLAYLYRQLGVASRGACDGIAGCLTLLQAWIYEYFPCFRPHQKRLTCGRPLSLMWSTKMEDKNEVRLRSIRTRLDFLTALEVNWLPYGPNPASIVPRTLFLGWLRYQDIIEPYMPERVLRQLGYKQVIPSSISRPEKAYRPEDSKLYEVEFPVMATESAWQIFPRGSKLILSEFQRNSNPSACSPDYLQWFLHKSHPFLIKEVYPKNPNRTNATYWMNQMLTVIQPWMDARDIMPTTETRDVAGEVDEIIREWNKAK